MSDAEVNAAVSANEVLDHIYTRFAEVRQQGKADAYRWLHEELSRNAGKLVPIVIPLKDYNALLLELEAFMKGSASQQGETPNEFLARWLTEPSVLGEHPHEEVVQ